MKYLKVGNTETTRLWILSVKPFNGKSRKSFLQVQSSVFAASLYTFNYNLKTTDYTPSESTQCSRGFHQTSRLIQNDMNHIHCNYHLADGINISVLKGLAKHLWLVSIRWSSWISFCKSPISVCSLSPSPSSLSHI